MLGGNNRTVVWSAAGPISDSFGKGERILGSAYASPNIGFPLPNKSDIEQITVYYEHRYYLKDTTHKNQSASKHRRRTFIHSATRELVRKGQLWRVSCMRQITLSLSGAPGDCID